MYRCKHFDIRELVPKEEYRALGDACWWLLDTRLLITLDALRDRYGLVIVNTWHSETLAKAYRYRHQAGFRNRFHYGSIAEYHRSHSQHKYGRAADCLFGSVTVNQVRSDVLSNPDWFPLITAVEADVPWLHIDVRNCDSVKVFGHG